LQAELAIRALQMALSERNWKAEELIITQIEECSMRQAITPKYWTKRRFNQHEPACNPYDNARAERFMRTLKEEEVHGTEYRDFRRRTQSNR